MSDVYTYSFVPEMFPGGPGPGQPKETRSLMRLLRFMECTIEVRMTVEAFDRFRDDLSLYGIELKSLKRIRRPEE